MAVGMQEAKARKVFQRQLTIYIVLLSQSLKDNYGCALWLCTSKPVANKGPKPVFLAARHIFTLVSKPRLLLAKGCGISCLYIVGHAPQPDDPTCEPWWHEFHEVYYAKSVIKSP